MSDNRHNIKTLERPKVIKRQALEKLLDKDVSIEIAHMYVLIARHRDKARDFLFRNKLEAA